MHDMTVFWLLHILSLDITSGNQKTINIKFTSSYFLKKILCNCVCQKLPTKLAVVLSNTESVFGQRNSEISDSDLHILVPTGRPSASPRAELRSPRAGFPLRGLRPWREQLFRHASLLSTAPATGKRGTPPSSSLDIYHCAI